MGDILYLIVYKIRDWVIIHSRFVVIVCIILTIVAGVYFTWVQVGRQGKVAVDIDVFPQDAKIRIDKVGDVSRGVYYLEPGIYNYTVSKDGYKTSSKSLTVTDQNPSNIYSVLAQNVTGPQSFSDDDKTKIQAIEGKSGAASLEFTKNFEKNYPIVKSLPIKDPYYQIGYLSDGKGGGFYLTVYTESPLYRNNALKRIKSMGENPSNYKIVFQDFKNPLTGENQ